MLSAISSHTLRRSTLDQFGIKLALGHELLFENTDGELALHIAQARTQLLLLRLEILHVGQQNGGLDHILHGHAGLGQDGSHVGQGVERGIEEIAEILNEIMTPDQKTTVLLETMAGKGSEVGGRFSELRAILDRTAYPEHMGVCLDTCHVSDAGYDIVSDLDGVLEEFDRIIGIGRLKALHLNDSCNPMGSHKDRHARLGEGTLGLETFYRIITHPVLKGLPMVLETPNELPGYAREIELLRDHED